MYLLASKPDTTENPDLNPESTPTARTKRANKVNAAIKAWRKAVAIYYRETAKNDPNDWGFNPDKDLATQDALVDAGVEFAETLRELGLVEDVQINLHVLNRLANEVRL